MYRASRFLRWRPRSPIHRKMAIEMTGTVADKTLDERAVDLIMGHADAVNEMDTRYIEEIGDDLGGSWCSSAL